MDAAGFTGPQVAVLSPYNDRACAVAAFCGLVGYSSSIGARSASITARAT
jgi:hypothetical protein